MNTLVNLYTGVNRYTADDDSRICTEYSLVSFQYCHLDLRAEIILFNFCVANPNLFSC